MGLTKRKQERAAKAFEVMMSTNSDGESDAAYETICNIGGVKLNDVARHIKGKWWETLYTGYRFELSDDFPLLTDGKQ